MAICLDRTADTPVARAAVLKVGAAYVPLDPTHPVDRIRYTLEDAGVACAITLGRFAPLVAASRARSSSRRGGSRARPELPAEPCCGPERLAYVIYTSGSTGRPKGVEVEHRNVVAFLEAMRREPGFAAHDSLLAVTTLSFDIAGLEFWLPLSVGGACGDRVAHRRARRRAPDRAHRRAQDHGDAGDAGHLATDAGRRMVRRRSPQGAVRRRSAAAGSGASS